ncbi:uncharacterized protein LOC130283842 isoform X2 [Hyla sarda]|nr:uncharacterized protein LOC130283842 isoform X2 [Hyla sarda]XP_056389400.1 uncharacterized protein LOC130283842 isoform X2 [Hyla sarda]XP_056389401.1 uncharacterized protein LOC130283842 isoform X2 [Hyla sarda]XP_056389402.1 uncharacterized protein LOC130283842 isoform X2 [Hyla sarda]
MPFDPKYLAIIWSFQGKQILVYDNKGITKAPRVTFDVEAVKDGRASLTVVNVSLSDGGTYSCLVVYSPERTERNIILEVQVMPTIILPKQTVRTESENTLHCQAVGFFPRDIEITWILDGKTQKQSLIREPVKNEDGTYNVTSDVTFTALKNKNLSCIVNHGSLHEPLQEDLQLIYEGTSAGIIAACVIVPLLIFLIAGVLLWKRKPRRKALGSFIIRDIEAPPKLIDGEEATLHCTVDNDPEDLCVTWWIRRSGQEQEIKTSQMRGHSEEEESLLDTSYVIRSQRDGHQYKASLSFIPHIERHRDVTFICRGVYGQHQKEKTFHCKTVYGKPKLSQPVIRSLFISGEVKYLLNLEKFYPKSIKIIWRCGVEKTEEILTSTESLSDNPDTTYNISSEVRIPEDRHKDPAFRVQVTWEHKSMDKPESRELSIRDPDYRWTPVVEEIQIPRLFHGSATTLQCNISEYFPDAVTVKWLLSPEHSAELYEEINTANNQRIISRRESDNTYSYTTSLTITPTRGKHQGAVYICLVDHPSLEKPIERRTGRLQVYAKPQMLVPIEKTIANSSRVQFSLNLRNFYPKNITISWYFENTSGKLEISPQQTVSTQDNHLTFNVTSVVSIPLHLFNDQQTKILVMWKHESMEMPETRSLSFRDLPWRPHVVSINVPKLEDETKATITCDISGYFPDHLSIFWFIKKDGNLTALPIESSKTERTYKISHKEKRQKDNTYSCEASLTFTPIIGSDQGSEIICRVGHPSVEGPIERSSGPLHIGEKKPILNFVKQLFNDKVPSVTGNKKTEEHEQHLIMGAAMLPVLFVTAFSNMLYSKPQNIESMTICRHYSLYGQACKHTP